MPKHVGATHAKQNTLMFLTRQIAVACFKIKKKVHEEKIEIGERKVIEIKLFHVNSQRNFMAKLPIKLRVDDKSMKKKPNISKIE